MYSEAEKELKHALKLEPENSLVLRVFHDLATEYISRNTYLNALIIYI
jgi:hypothetical protein